MKTSPRLKGAMHLATNVTVSILLILLSFNESMGQLSLAGFTLTVDSISGPGTLKGSLSSSLITNANTTVHFASDGRVLQNLTVNGGSLTLGTALEITGGEISNAAGVVTVVPGSTLFTNGLLTLKSNQFGTARVAPGAPVGNYINGNVTVERYIPDNGFRSWRLLSVPTHSSGQTIKQAWQEGQASMTLGSAGLGTLITGRGQGFDGAPANASMLSYNGVSNNWSGITNTNIPIATSNAYFLFVRGDRSQLTSTLTTNATTLRTNGALYQGSNTVAVAAGQFAVVGNVFASSIDFTKIQLNGVDELFYLWDSKQQVGTSLGVYQTFSKTNSYQPLINSNSYPAGNSNVSIQSGQAFFVRNSGSAAGSVVIDELVKIDGSNTAGLRPVFPGEALVKLDTKLVSLIDQDSSVVDANAVVFNDVYQNLVDANDAVKLANPGENLGVSVGLKVLAVEGRKQRFESDTIFYKLWNLKKQSYRLEFLPTNLEGLNVKAVLEDAYLKTNSFINLSSAGYTDFKVDDNVLSAAQDRFRLILKKQLVPYVDSSNAESKFVISPNPFEGTHLNLQFHNKLQGKYNIKLLSVAGQLLYQGIIAHPGGTNTSIVKFPAGIPGKGLCFIKITCPDNTVSTQSLVVK